MYGVEQDDVIVVSGLFGSGTTYYTRLLNHTGWKAEHEWMYWAKGIRGPKEGQTHEVSGWSFPYRTDVLLLRDPRQALRTLKRHNPHYHEFTHRHLGYHPHTTKLLARSWVEWTRMALERDPAIVWLHDLPQLPLVRHASRGAKQAPHTWDELGPEVAELAAELGFVVQ